MKVYKPKILTIFIFAIFGILFLFILLMAITSTKHFSISKIFVIIGFLVFIFLLFWDSIKFWNYRKKGIGIYWDEEGVVVDFVGNKIFWDEIENIEFIKTKSSRTTFVRVHYSKEEQVRLRHKLPLKNIFWRYSGSIEWFEIEKPKEMHTNLVNYWEKKKFYFK
ncbi:hypothetical protein AN960_09450 [Bacillus sp. FJAT-25509]|uniref:hypothetical protein n=1 Tax=Bacillaceae TaxID=186817 RepID=UPI0006FD254B|nr:hypothetical protein [Bacillus sp. FJAT-25509]KQL39192.1 hypothetical protein AN960_09450 [Bacillus sp. FJAT-25509]